MKKVEIKQDETDTRTTVMELVESLGIQLVVWGKLIEETDSNDAYTDYDEMKEEMRSYAVLLHHLAKMYPRILRKMGYRLPDGYIVTTVDNPLYDPKAKEDDPDMGDVPF